MTRVQIKGIHKVRAKGNEYIYAWRGGPRLHAKIGSPEFFREYQQAISERRRPQEGTINRLIIDLKESAEFAKLAASTKREYVRHLDAIKERFGSAPIKAFDDRRIKSRIRAWRDTISHHPRTADYAMATLKRLLSFGVENGHLSQNLARGFRSLHSSDRSEIIWSPGDLAALAQQSSRALTNAVDLARLTGLRRGDLVNLAWEHRTDDWIEYRTSKRGKPVVIPIIAETRAVLDRIAGSEGSVLRNTRGAPWTPDGLSTAFQRARAATGLKKRWHDLRGNAATAFCVAGFDDREVAEIIGWSENRVSSIRRKYVDRAAIIKAAIRRVDGGGAGQ
jgi:integrase